MKHVAYSLVIMAFILSFSAFLITIDASGRINDILEQQKIERQRVVVCNETDHMLIDELFTICARHDRQFAASERRETQIVSSLTTALLANKTNSRTLTEVITAINAAPLHNHASIDEGIDPGIWQITSGRDMVQP